MIHDISQPLSAATACWPGDTRFAARATWTIGPDCPVNVSAVTLSTHAGTHADAPLHYDAGGAAIDALALDIFIGPARVVDVSDGTGPVAPAEIAEALVDAPPRLLLRTFRHFPHGRWGPFRPVAPDTIAAMAAAGIRLVGTDAPSIDPEESKTLDAHHAVLAADLRIVEGLVLDGVAPGDWELVALPLKLAGLDAAPVRAILRTLP